MRKIKFPALILAVLMLMTSFSSCGYEVIIRKKGTEESTTAAYIPTAPVMPVPTVPVTQPVPTLPSGENIMPEVTPGIEVDKTYMDMSMAPADVIELYSRAVNDVKLRCPGYTRTIYQDVSDIETDRGDKRYVKKVFEDIGDRILEDSGDENETVQIMAHDDVAVRETFPLYNQVTGCDFTDISIVKFANCYTDGSTYKIVISFEDQLNPDSVNSQFARIMTPVDRSAAASTVLDYTKSLKLNSYDFDLNYTNCEIVCIIDKASSRMISLQQKMIIDADILMYLDLYLFSAREVNASGTMVNRLEYFNFDWS